MIKATMTKHNRASALGVDVVANAPVLALCRKLIEQSHDPAERLEAYRGDVLCLTISSLAEGAKWIVDETQGTGRPKFVRDRPGRFSALQEVGPATAD